MDAFARSVPLTGADQIVSAAPAVFSGYAIRETAGATATVRIFDNASAATGALLATVRLAANETADVVHSRGVWAEHGIYVDVSGAVEGSARIG